MTSRMSFLSMSFSKIVMSSYSSFPESDRIMSNDAPSKKNESRSRMLRSSDGSDMMRMRIVSRMFGVMSATEPLNLRLLTVSMMKKGLPSV